MYKKYIEERYAIALKNNGIEKLIKLYIKNENDLNIIVNKLKKKYKIKTKKITIDNKELLRKIYEQNRQNFNKNDYNKDMSFEHILLKMIIDLGEINILYDLVPSSLEVEDNSFSY